MRRRVLWALCLAGAAALWFGCVAKETAFPDADMLMRTGSAPEGAEPEALRRGRALAITDCVGCHRLYNPGEFPPEAWGRISRDMGGRASLSKQQIADMELYFRAASRATRAPAATQAAGD